MPTKTFFVVQPFEAGKRGAIKPGRAMEVRSAEEADRVAKRLSLVNKGAIAFSREIDPEFDDGSPPVLIASYGEVPEEALDAG